MAKQGASFESGITRHAMILAVAPLIVSLLLLWNGVYYLNKFPGARNLPWLIIFSIAPLLFGAAIIAVAVVTAQKNMGRKVTVTPDGLVYSHGNDSFAMKWAVTAFSIGKGSKLWRTMAITDGKHVVRIEELFFPDFDGVAKAVTEAKGGRR